MYELSSDNSIVGIELPAELPTELSDKLFFDFFQVAKNVYQGDPYWIPEDEDKIREQLSSKNTYFNNCHAKIFLHETDARLVGFYNPELRIEGESAVYFGFWETKNNAAINRELFTQLERWAQGFNVTKVESFQIYGPINFSTYQNNRLRMNDFEGRSFIDEPHNPSYYSSLLEQLNFERKYNYITATNENIDELVQQIKIPFSKLKAQVDDTFLFERLTGEVWLENLKNLYPLVDAIFSQNFAYTPVSWDAFKAQCGENFARKLCPKSSVLVRDLQGDIAGFFITYPDYSSLVNQSAVNAGEHIVDSNICYATHYPLLTSPRLLLAKTCGVAPKYRSSGLFPLMSMQLSLWAAGLYEQVSAAMVREGNPSVSFYKSLIEGGNKDFVFRNYALFKKPITCKKIRSGGMTND